MALTKFEKDMNIIDLLHHEPNDVGGMSADAFQQKFDEGGLALQEYINNTLIPELEAQGVLETLRTKDSDVKYIRLNTDGAIEVSADNVTWVATASSGHVVMNKDGNTLPQRSRMKFTNSVVTDVDGVTVVDGIKGDKGDQGIQGIKGDKGDKGNKGDKGAAWYPSVDSLGNITFTLSDTSTPPPIYNIRGPQGPQGVQGLQGLQGATGAQGLQGIQGVRGIQGIQGEKGEQGEQGARGIQGVQGAQGVQGEKGDNGADGRSFVVQDVYPTLGELKIALPTGNEYAYQISADKNVYIWSEITNDWVSLGQLQGVQGEKGDQGIQGIQGVQGEKGDKGDKGDQGIQGIQGETGAQGVQGIQGVAGADGKSAYSSACEGGYTGTETTFNSALADVPNKANKKVPTATGNIATLDATGNLADSGKQVSDFIPTSAKGVANGVASLNENGVIPISQGGTGANTASGARSNLGAASRLSGTATLSTSSWSGSSAPFTCTLSVSGITSSDTPHVDRVTGTDAAAAKLINEAWALISGCDVKPRTSAGKIIFYASKKPTSNIPIMWEVVR